MVETRYAISKEHNTVMVAKVGSPHQVAIKFKRTIRVPDNNGQTSSLPPDMGNFPLYNVKDYKAKLPVPISEKGGLFLPIHRGEAMWIDFRSSGPFLVKIYAGGINVVSGETYDEDVDSKIRRLALLEKEKQVQDYVVVPKQPWLDGVATSPGVVRQFVAVQQGTGYSIEAQLKGSEMASGLTFEVTPAKEPEPHYLGLGSLNLTILTLTGAKIPVVVGSHDTAHELRSRIQDRTGIPPDQQRLIYRGKRIEDFLKLAHYKIESEDTVHLVLRLRGGGLPPTEAEMKLAQGGRIKQVIQTDHCPSDIWHPAHTMTFNVQLLNSQAFESVIGQTPPGTPITAEAYAQAGLPFFDMYEEPSHVRGNFEGVKSVGELDGTSDTVVEPSLVRLNASDRRVHPDYNILKEIVSDRDGLLDPAGPLAKFRTVHDLVEELGKLSVNKTTDEEP